MTRPIFLLSLPRAGSTLLQRLLLASGQCSTLGEPSLLLRLLGEDEVIQRRATYWESLVDTACADMRGAWPGFDDAYRTGVRELMERLYGGLAEGKEWFLDKTPRYTLIAEELIRTFPDAKFIILWRHPLAVAASISSTFREGRWCPDEFGIDLFEGLERLQTFSKKHQDSICEIRYEDLVAEPKAQMERLGEYLGWTDLASVVDAELPESAGGTLGDPTGVKQYSKVSSESRDAWIGKVDNWYSRAWCRRYWTGERVERLEAQGYELPAEIEAGGGSLAGGVMDWFSAKRRIRRRIMNPTWLPRHARKFGKEHDFGVLFR